MKSRKGAAASGTPPSPAPPAVEWRLPATPAGLAATAWAALVVFVFLRRHPLPVGYLLDALDRSIFTSTLAHPYALKMLLSLGLAAWILAVITRWGLFGLEKSGFLPSLDRLERVCFGAALGLGGLSLMTFAAGALRAWHAAVFWAFLAASTLFFLWERRLPPAPSRPRDQPAGTWRPAWIGLLSLLFLILLAGALMPEIFFDSLFYHLGYPDQYRLHRRLVAFPLIYSNFMLTLQMAYGFAITVGNALVAKLLHASTAALLGLACVAFCRRFLTPAAGWMSAAILLSTPLLGYNATTAGMDVGWTFLQFMASYALVVAIRDQSLAWVRLAGLLTGFSAACKYPAFPYIPLSAVVLAWFLRRDGGRSWRETGWWLVNFIAPAALVLAPFLLRNLVDHLNPLYPFGGTRWGIPRIEPLRWQYFIGDAPQRVLKNEFASAAAAMRFILHPWHLTMEGAGTSHFAGPLFLALLVPLCLTAVRSLPGRVLRAQAILFWAVWLLTTTTTRYGLPALALLAPVLSQAALSVRPWRAPLLAVLFLGAAANTGWMALMIHQTDGWQVVGGRSAEGEYLQRQHGTYPTPPYEAYEWINRNLPREAKVMVVGDSRSYYLDRRAVPAAVYDPQPILRYAREGSADRMAGAMRREGVTHICLNLGEAVRTEGYQLFPFQKAEWQTLQAFWNRYVDLVWKKEDLRPGAPQALYVYRFLGENDAARPHAAPPNPFERWAPR